MTSLCTSSGLEEMESSSRFRALGRVGGQSVQVSLGSLPSQYIPSVRSTDDKLSRTYVNVLPRSFVYRFEYRLSVQRKKEMSRNIVNMTTFILRAIIAKNWK